MKEVIEYLGQEIEVDEKVKSCLEELDRKEDSLARKNRRQELLWDSTLVEGMDGVKNKTGSEDHMEDMVMDLMENERIREAVEELDELDRGIIIDRFFKQMKFRDIAEKYRMPSSTIETRIKRVLKRLEKMIKSEK